MRPCSFGFSYTISNNEYKVLSDWVQLWQRFLIDEGMTEEKRAIIGPPAKRHLNGVSLAC